MTLDHEIRRHLWTDDREAFHDALSHVILARESADPGLRVSNVQGWHSAPDLMAWNDPPVEPLVERIRVGADSVGAGEMRVHAWANVMRTGAYQLAHRHGDAVWSGVYYVEAGREPGGEITFARGHASLSIKPTTGLMLIFPGDLLHSVAPYTGAGTRISVAFNLF